MASQEFIDYVFGDKNVIKQRNKKGKKIGQMDNINRKLCTTIVVLDRTKNSLFGNKHEIDSFKNRNHGVNLAIVPNKQRKKFDLRLSSDKIDRLEIALVQLVEKVKYYEPLNSSIKAAPKMMVFDGDNNGGSAPNGKDRKQKYKTSKNKRKNESSSNVFFDFGFAGDGYDGEVEAPRRHSQRPEKEKEKDKEKEKIKEEGKGEDDNEHSEGGGLGALAGTIFGTI